MFGTASNNLLGMHWGRVALPAGASTGNAEPADRGLAANGAVGRNRAADRRTRVATEVAGTSGHEQDDDIDMDHTGAATGAADRPSGATPWPIMVTLAREHKPSRIAIDRRGGSASDRAMMTTGDALWHGHGVGQDVETSLETSAETSVETTLETTLETTTNSGVVPTAGHSVAPDPRPPSLVRAITTAASSSTPITPSSATITIGTGDDDELRIRTRSHDPAAARHRHKNHHQALSYPYSYRQRDSQSTHLRNGGGFNGPLPRDYACDYADMSHKPKVPQQTCPADIVGSSHFHAQSTAALPPESDRKGGQQASKDVAVEGHGVRGDHYGPEYGRRHPNWPRETAWPPEGPSLRPPPPGPPVPSSVTFLSRVDPQSRPQSQIHQQASSEGADSLTVGTASDYHRFHGNAFGGGEHHHQHPRPRPPQGLHSHYSPSAHPSCSYSCSYSDSTSHRNHHDDYYQQHYSSYPQPGHTSTTQQPTPPNSQHHYRLQHYPRNSANSWPGPPSLYPHRYPPYPGARTQVPPPALNHVANGPYSCSPQYHPQYPHYQSNPGSHQAHHSPPPPPGPYPPWPVADPYRPPPPLPTHAPHPAPDSYAHYYDRGPPAQGPPPPYSSSGTHTRYRPHPLPLPLPPLRSSHQYRNSVVFPNAATGPLAARNVSIAGAAGSRAGSAYGSSPHVRHSLAPERHEVEGDGRDEVDRDEDDDEEQPVLAGRRPMSAQRLSAANGREQAQSRTDATDDRGNLASGEWLKNALAPDKTSTTPALPTPSPYSTAYPPNNPAPVQPPHAPGPLPLAALAQSYATAWFPHVAAPTKGPWAGHEPNSGGKTPPGPRFGFEGPAGYLGFDHLFPGGHPLLRRRDYFVFTATTYELMVRAIRVDRNLPEFPEGIERAISSSVSLTAAHHPAGLTRKKWIRLKGRLELHADRDGRRCLAWKGCPLIIVPEDDWAHVIKSVHVLAGRPGIHASPKLTYSLIRNQYQTRRSRCGIPQDMISEFCAICADCASGVFVTDTCPESARNGAAADQATDQAWVEAESGASDQNDDDASADEYAARLKKRKKAAAGGSTSSATLPTRGRPGKRKEAAPAASMIASVVTTMMDGETSEQGESGDSRPTKRQRVDDGDRLPKRRR